METAELAQSLDKFFEATPKGTRCDVEHQTEAYLTVNRSELLRDAE